MNIDEQDFPRLERSLPLKMDNIAGAININYSIHISGESRDFDPNTPAVFELEHLQSNVLAVVVIRPVCSTAYRQNTVRTHQQRQAHKIMRFTQPARTFHFFTVQ